MSFLKSKKLNFARGSLKSPEKKKEFDVIGLICGHRLASLFGLMLEIFIRVRMMQSEFACRSAERVSASYGKSTESVCRMFEKQI